MPSGYAVAIVIGVYPFLISWFFNRCLLLAEKKRAECLDKDEEILGRIKGPISVAELKERKEKPSQRLLEAIEDLAALRAKGRAVDAAAIERVTRDRTAREPRRAVLEMAAWLAGVLLVTVGLGVWPLLRGGLSPLRELGLLWVTREQALESAEILLVGGVITILSGIGAVLCVPLAWRPVRHRFIHLLEELAPRL